MITGKSTVRKYWGVTMKKIKFLILPLIAATTLTACSGEVNKGPELRGVNDVICLANTVVDLLDGVAALDLEDGDITPELQITVTPYVAVENGYAKFKKAGEYDVCYEVRDSGGKIARNTVTATVKEREIYLDNVLTNGFSLKTGGKVKVLNEGLNGNVYSFKAEGGEIAENVKLTRTYALINGVEYTFRYCFNCNISGKIKVAANGLPFAEKFVVAGENNIEFTYTAKDGAADIELWFGGLEGELEISVSKAETEYEGEAGERELAGDFKFSEQTIENRDGNAHAVYASDDGKSATLEITNPSGAIWKDGMFVNTGILLEANREYVISFDIDSKLGNDYQICIQHDKWQDSDAYIIDNAQGHVTETVVATDSFKGGLWLFIRSGLNRNNITISNLSVKVIESGLNTESYGVSAVEAGGGEAKCEYGKIIYEVSKFGNVDNDNELRTPVFTLMGGGAASNYVITFKAKATVPVTCIFVAPLYVDWDPVLVWSSFKITAEENTYSFYCNDVDMNGSYRFIWQFGSAFNAAYTAPVTVEISEIKICIKSELEG